MAPPCDAKVPPPDLLAAARAAAAVRVDRFPPGPLYGLNPVHGIAMAESQRLANVDGLAAVGAPSDVARDLAALLFQRSPTGVVPVDRTPSIAAVIDARTIGHLLGRYVTGGPATGASTVPAIAAVNVPPVGAAMAELEQLGRLLTRSPDRAVDPLVVTSLQALLWFRVERIEDFARYYEGLAAGGVSVPATATAPADGERPELRIYQRLAESAPPGPAPQDDDAHAASSGAATGPHALAAVDYRVLRDNPAVNALWPDARNCDAVSLGWFRAPFSLLNVDEVLSGCHARTLEGAAFAAVRDLRKKRWHYLSAANDQYIWAMALADTGYQVQVFIYLASLTNPKDFVEYKTMLPLQLGLQKFAPSSVAGETSFHISNFFDECDIDIKNASDQYRVSFRFKKRSLFGDDETGSGELTFVPAQSRKQVPLSNVREVARHRLVYTHQESDMGVQGALRWGSRQVAFNGPEAFGGMDYTVGYHKYRTDWYWASGAGRARDGGRIAFNLAADITQGTNNVAVYWINGAIYRAERAHFVMIDDKTWRIHDDAGLVDLYFTKVGARMDKLNLGLFSVDYEQPYGHFRGTLRATRDSPAVAFDNAQGVAERHDTKW